MAKRPYQDMASEHAIQRTILQYLLFHAKADVHWFAIPNQGQRSLRMGARMRDEGMLAGVADLCIMLHEGRAGWMECKTAIGRQTDAQKSFEARCERLGHSYAVVRSLEEAVPVLKRWGALK